MTKSTITRERAQQIFLGNGPEQSASEERELARMTLVAMDSEPVELPLDYLQGHKDGLEWAAQLAEANHPETGDWLYDDPIELAKAIRKGPDMPPAQPAADSEPVAWMWHYFKQWHVTNDEERARDLAWDGVKVAPLYRHAQPAPVVPTFDEWLELSGNKPLGWVKDAMRESYDACRAAMLNHPEQHLDMVDHSGDVNEKGGDGNSPVIPEGWQVEAEKLAEMHGMSFVLFRHGEAPQCADPTKVVISFTDKGLGHDTLPAAHQEVK